MSDHLGPVSYKTAEEDPFVGREFHKQQHFSDRTLELIDEETARILKDADERAFSLLKQYSDELERLTKSLLKYEELDAQEIEKVIGPSVHQRSREKAVVGDAKMAAKDSISDSDL
jgi:cell division protease FtsH